MSATKNIKGALEKLVKAIEAKPNFYCVSARHSILSPITITMRIKRAKVLAMEYFALLLYDESDNEITITLITSVRKHGDWIVITCGVPYGQCNDGIEKVYISEGWPDSMERAKLQIRTAA
ncbi:MAG: hypothetical protein IJ418_16515 [Clostridia bacterium]|nr:hypothetical protein [Clostridia bacterium]